MAKTKGKRAPIKGFYRQCSPERCDDLDAYVRRVADLQVGFQRRMKGGIEARVLEPARIRAKGTLREYTLGERRGLPLEFRRCFEYDYVNARQQRNETATCTEVATYSVPRNAIDCYKQVSKVLVKLRPVKRGRPAKKGREDVANEVLAFAGCSAKITRRPPLTHVEYQTVTPSVASMVTGNKLSAVRNAINNLVWQGKLVSEAKPEDNVTRRLLRVLSNEKMYVMPKPYAVDFDEFLRGEQEQRVAAGFRRVFGRDVIDVPAPEVPKGARREMRGGAEVIKKGWEMPEGWQMGATAQMRAEAEEEAWRRRTGIRQPRFRNIPVPEVEAEVEIPGSKAL